MKRINLTLAIVTFASIAVTAQNTKFRVDQIVEVKANKSNNTTDTIVQNFNYVNGELTQVLFLRNNKPIDTLNYNYKNDTITVTNQYGRMERLYILNESKVVKEYMNDACNKFTFTTSNNKTKSVDRFNKCEKYSEGNTFEYNGNGLSTVKTYAKTQPKITTNYVFTYKKDKLIKIEWNQNVEVFAITWNGSKIKTIEHSRLGVKEWKDEFVYDDHGNVLEETIYKIVKGKEFLANKYIISYSENKGNDNLIWSTYHWKINSFLNQRTYNKYIEIKY